jgi:anti-sigma factor RsiW
MANSRTKNGGSRPARKMVAPVLGRLDERVDFKFTLREKAAITRSAASQPDTTPSDLYRRAARALIAAEGIPVPESDDEALAILTGS